MKLKYILIYLLIINFLSFALFFIDKYKARKYRWRIKERTLHIVGFMGGIIGSMTAMMFLRHKIKKRKFVFITIIGLFFNIFIIYTIINFR